MPEHMSLTIIGLIEKERKKLHLEKPWVGEVSCVPPVGTEHATLHLSLLHSPLYRIIHALLTYRPCQHSIWFALQYPIDAEPKWYHSALSGKNESTRTLCTRQTSCEVPRWSGDIRKRHFEGPKAVFQRTAKHTLSAESQRSK